MGLVRVQMSGWRGRLAELPEIPVHFTQENHAPTTLVQGTNMATLSLDDFADRFKDSSQKLWCIAAAIVGDTNQAEDVLQEAAVIALQKLDQFEPDTSFAAWMAQIVRFVALNTRRARGRSVSVDPARLNESIEAPRRPAPAELSSRGVLADDQAHFDDEVRRALATLDDTARACLLLRSVMDMPYREIARTLDIPEGTAMSHVHRARRALSETLYPTAHRPLVSSGDSS